MFRTRTGSVLPLVLSTAAQLRSIAARLVLPSLRSSESCSFVACGSLYFSLLHDAAAGVRSMFWVTTSPPATAKSRATGDAAKHREAGARVALNVRAADVNHVPVPNARHTAYRSCLQWAATLAWTAARGLRCFCQRGWPPQRKCKRYPWRRVDVDATPGKKIRTEKTTPPPPASPTFACNATAAASEVSAVPS